MINRNEFIEREIVPALGEFAGEYDANKICDAVAEYDPRAGYVFKAAYQDDDPNHSAFWAAVADSEINPGEE